MLILIVNDEPQKNVQDRACEAQSEVLAPAPLRTAKDVQPGKKGFVCLPPERFIGRFLQHVVQRGFKCTRRYGILASTHKHRRLVRCRQTLRMPASDPAVTETVDAFMRWVTGRELACCRRQVAKFRKAVYISR
jgi:hypothetical protein